MRAGLWSPGDGVIDIHAVTQALVRSITAAGGVLDLGVEVARVEVTGGRVSGVRWPRTSVSTPAPW